MKINTIQKKIPQGWFETTIEKECDILKGQGLSKNKLSINGKNKCILYGELYTTYSEIIDSIKSHTESEEGIRSKSGDILIPASTTTIAKDLAIAAALNKDHVLLGGDINILRRKKNSYDANFLAYYLTHYKNKELAELAQGITIIHLYGKDFKRLNICIPKSLNEQRKIADILYAVDKDIVKTQNVIDITEKVKKGLMQDLFTHGIGHTRFKKTKLGEIPESWSVVRIKDSTIKLIDGDRGANYPKQKDFSSDGYCLFLSAKNVSKKGFIFNELSFISRDKDESLRKGKLERGDIILTSRGTVGNAAYYDENVPFENIRINSGMLIIRHGEQFDPIFLYKYFSSPQMKSKYLSMGSGSAQPQLPIGSLELVEVPVLPIDEQKKIAEIISAIDEKITINKKLKARLTKLKKGLMQDLLSGKVRII